MLSKEEDEDEKKDTEKLQKTFFKVVLLYKDFAPGFLRSLLLPLCFSSACLLPDFMGWSALFHPFFKLSTALVSVSSHLPVCTKRRNWLFELLAKMKDNFKEGRKTVFCCVGWVSEAIHHWT